MGREPNPVIGVWPTVLPPVLRVDFLLGFFAFGVAGVVVVVGSYFLSVTTEDEGGNLARGGEGGEELEQDDVSVPEERLATPVRRLRWRLEGEAAACPGCSGEPPTLPLFAVVPVPASERLENVETKSAAVLPPPTRAAAALPVSLSPESGTSLPRLLIECGRLRTTKSSPEAGLSTLLLSSEEEEEVMEPSGL